MTLTDKQLALRKSGIGASEIGAIAGLNPWKTAIDVWADKLDLVERRDSEASSWGHRLEPVVAEAWAERFNVPLSALRTCDSLVHPQEAWVLATPDRLVEHEGRVSNLEIKTLGHRQAHRWGEEGTDQIPEEYLAQTQWQMLVIRAALNIKVELTYVAALIGGQELRSYVVPYDPALAGDLVDIGRDFWTRHVLTKEPPPVADSRRAAEYLAARYPRHEKPLLIADAAGRKALEHLRAAREAFDLAEAEKVAAEVAVKDLLKDAEGIESEVGKVTWKASKDRASTNWEAVAKEAGASDEIIRKHTQSKPGPRVLRCSFTNREE